MAYTVKSVIELGNIEKVNYVKQPFYVQAFCANILLVQVILSCGMEFMCLQIDSVISKQFDIFFA